MKWLQIHYFNPFPIFFLLGVQKFEKFMIVVRIARFLKLPNIKR